jgi:ADP-heptose:LPS heptosyltransferase
MIRRNFHDSKVYVLATSRPSADLLTAGGIVDSAVVFRRYSLKNIVRYAESLRTLKELKPDIVIGAAGLDPVFVSVLSFLSGARLRVGANWRGRGFLFTHAISLDGHEYEATQNLRLAECLLGEPHHDSIDVQRISLGEKLLHEGQKWKGALNLKGEATFVGLHPGSGAEQKWKRWDLKNFAELSHRLEATGSYACIFFLGPDEEDLETALLDLNVPPWVVFRGNQSILQTAARIAQCQLFVANDSGLRQLAVSLGVPSIGIFGPTGTEKNFTPDGLHEAVTADNVLCRPCHYTRWWLSCGKDQRCLTGITVEAVLAKVVNHIQGPCKNDPAKNMIKIK